MFYKETSFKSSHTTTKVTSSCLYVNTIHSKLRKSIPSDESRLIPLFLY